MVSVRFQIDLTVMVSVRFQIDLRVMVSVRFQIDQRIVAGRSIMFSLLFRRVCGTLYVNETDALTPRLTRINHGRLLKLSIPKPIFESGLSR